MFFEMRVAWRYFSGSSWNVGWFCWPHHKQKWRNRMEMY